MVLQRIRHVFANSEAKEKKTRIIYKEETVKDKLGNLANLVFLIILAVAMILIGFGLLSIAYEQARVPGEEYRFYPFRFIMGLASIGIGIGLPIYASLNWFKRKSEA
jgi:hypothetical protein